MTFDYNTLKKAAANGGRIGNWKDLPVFAVKKDDLRKKGNGAYYIIYDDGNKLVKKTADTFFCYGSIDKNGVVTEQSAREYSLYEAYYMEKKVETSSQPQAAVPVAPGPDIDVRLEMDVDATLKKARELTIGDLLKGFDYGLV